MNVFGTDYAIKCQEKLSKNVLFCPTNSPKLKDIKFIIIYDKEKQQRLTTEKLELGNVLHFCSKKKKKMIHQFLNHQNSYRFHVG